MGPLEAYHEDRPDPWILVVGPQESEAEGHLVDLEEVPEVLQQHCQDLVLYKESICVSILCIQLVSKPRWLDRKIKISNLTPSFCASCPVGLTTISNKDGIFFPEFPPQAGGGPIGGGGPPLGFGGPWKVFPSGQGGGGPGHGPTPGTGPAPGPGAVGPPGGTLPCGTPDIPKSAGAEESPGVGLGGVGRRPTPGGGFGRGLMPCFLSSSTSFSSSAPASASSASIFNKKRGVVLR